MDTLPPELIAIIGTQLDPESFIRFYETGWSGASAYPQFSKLHVQKCIEFAKLKKEEAISDARDVLRTFCRVISTIPNLQGFDQSVEENMDRIEYLLYEIHEKYK